MSFKVGDILCVGNDLNKRSMITILKVKRKVYIVTYPLVCNFECSMSCDVLNNCCRKLTELEKVLYL